ncbi:hypothetical protein BT67DRAFT_442566 [Trichocladium antarcticum]|uniref:Uncharacterized protein n=1 Tax=Trichocladium antarcticum TaxID=1450529 RepID=A0AAN6UJ92_9PEZI|nr:hypothetical protein BT67DRAFT_442566 [Trichocladium antarcticum]
MAPLIPRMHVFEIADFPWFPDFLRAYFQAALTAAWTTHIPILQDSSPARLVAYVLSTRLPGPLGNYTIIDFCAGGGGPTPSIEHHLNHPGRRRGATQPSASDQKGQDETAPPPPIKFILTDLHPHPHLWAEAARQSANIEYVPYPVDAANVPGALVERHRDGGKKKVLRLFNLSFHHFDDALAMRILKGTVDGAQEGEGFGIFELQDRGIAGFLSCCLFGMATLMMAPYFALLWGEPLALLFTYVLPILPVVLVFDGWMSCLRTRTTDEVVALLKACGAEGGQEEIAKWEITSGSETFMWPVGRVNWIMGLKK